MMATHNDMDDVTAHRPASPYGGVFNVATGASVTILELAEAIVRSVGAHIMS